MNLLLFNGKLTDEDREIIWFWMNRKGDQWYGEDPTDVNRSEVLFYDRQKVLAKAREYLEHYNSGVESYSKWKNSITNPTYEKLLKLMEEANEKDTKVRTAR